MTQKFAIRRMLALLTAVLMVTSVLGPVGTVAAVDGITVSQQADSTTVNPGDTITLTTDVAVDGSQIDANSIGLQEDLPDGWTVTSRTDGSNLGSGPDGWLWFSTTGVDGSDTVSYTVEVPSSASAGDYTLSITASTESDESTTTDTTITVEESSTGGGDTIAVNTGGAEYTANDGTVYTADQYFTGGQTFTSGSAGTPSQPEIANTDDDELYWTERYGADFSYDVPVDNGQYEVTLHFAELYQGVANNGGEGDRVFDASIEGQTVLDDYDIIAEAGAPQTAITETFTAEVTDGELNIAFDAQGDDGVDNAKISAIEITPVEAPNTAPTIESIDDQTVVEGDSTTVPVTTSDVDGDSVSLSLSQSSPDFVSLSNGDVVIAPQSGDAGTYTVDVIADDGTTTTTESFQVTVEEPAPQTGSALVEILPDTSNVDASTYGSGSYQVTNTGEKEITSVSFDLSSASLPDMVFDPDGTAGDPTGEGLNIVSEGGTGITTAGGGSDEAFSQPHNGVDGSDGYDVMTVEFNDFQNGETATFWADNDPTSIKGATVGSQEAGPVSGLELARATVTVTYADGTSQTTQLMGDGSAGGSTAVVTDDEAPAPTIGAQDVTLDGSVLDARHSGATVSEASQTITVSGEPGETVTLVRVEGELSLSNVPDADNSGEPGYDIEALEANNAVNVEYYSVTLDSNGEATVPVTLTDSADDDDEAGFNYFVAAHGEASGDMGLASNVVVLKLDESAVNTAPTIDAITDTGVSQDGSATVDVTASDAEGDSLSLSVSGPSWVSLTDNNDGTGSLSVAPGTDVPVGTYTVEVTASDGQATSEVEEFAVYVDNADQDGETVFAVNAGGPEYTASDGTVYQADSGAAAFDGGSTYRREQAIAGTDDDTLYQSERYGGANDGNFGYDVPISEPGTYEVTLQFAEIFQGVAGSDSPGGADGTDENDRLFSISIEGQTVVSEYDIFSEVGPLTATEKTYTVEVTEEMLSDGTLNIDFSASADNGKVSAITVEKLDSSSDAPGIISDFEDAPTDPDGDGKYEDVNGDGSVDVGDAQALFANDQDPEVQNNVDAFDYNDDGSVNVGDVQTLFANGMEA